ncbi:hypothetical protein CRE_19156 [Caenorhabditis remanei]|uniref:G-protein coupled receptors family 1 profile domain-containing protein n=1 Tax=Caenorhabditis remanei TaxID=31234 RepID=E3MJL2_CAERE|nr:hypothetical protein CRE_19156 [Caenorhabditis remanei]
MSSMYRAILSVLYPIFFIIVFPSQLLLIYIILRHSPKYLKTLQLVLFCNCVSQIVSLVLCCLLQTRQVSHLTPIEIWCYGPMRHFDAVIPYSMYYVAQAATLFSSVITFLTIYLKYEAASSFKQAKTLRVIVIILLFAPIIILSGAEAYLIITNALPAEIQEKFSTINIDSSDHSVIGYITLKTYSSVIIFVILCCSVFILPPIGFFVRRKILNVVTSNIDRNSSLKKSQSRSFINGLTLQAFLPLICYTPMFIYLFVILVTKSEMLFEQYFIGVFTILPTLCDSFITMYSVTPYRKQIRTWLGMEKTEQMVMVAPHSQMF